MSDAPDTTIDERAPKIRKLPGRGRPLAKGIVSSEGQRLYLAPDHLIVLRVNYLEETHKRFYFEDIQAITVQTNVERTIRATIMFVLTLAIIAFGMLIDFQAGTFPGVASSVAGVVALFPAALLLWDLLSGPTCTTRLHTAVQVEELTALRRVRVARKCLAILAPHIEAAQGAWPDDVSSPGAIVAQGPCASSNAPELMRKTRRKVVQRTLHVVTFALVSVWGFSAMVDMVYVHDIKHFLDTILSLGAISLLIGAVVYQANSTLLNSTQVLVWASLITSAVFVLAFIYIQMIIQMADMMQAGDPPGFFMWQQLDVDDFPGWFRALIGLSGVVNVVLGGLGLASLRGYRVVQAPKAPADSPEDPGAP